jgi:hypothetical protein
MQTLIPGRATVSDNLQGPGVYVDCFGEKRVTETATYLQNHASLVWVPADGNNASTIPNIIKVKGDESSFEFAIGRINLSYLNDTIEKTDGEIFFYTQIRTNYTQVAKVHIDNSLNFMVYADTNQHEQVANTNFEVLTCLERSCGKMSCEVSGLQLNDF